MKTTLFPPQMFNLKHMSFTIFFSSFRQLLKIIETKEGTFFSRMLQRVGGMFLQGSGESKNISIFQLSPFSSLHIGLLFDSAATESKPVTEIDCSETREKMENYDYFLTVKNIIGLVCSEYVFPTNEKKGVFYSECCRYYSWYLAAQNWSEMWNKTN